MSWNLVPLVVGLLAVVPPSVTELTEPALTVSLAQAEARRNAPELAELMARVRAAEQIADDSGRVFRRDPTVFGSYTPGALLGKPDEYSWQVGLSVPVDLSTSWIPRRDSAEASLEAARQSREDALRALDEAVAIAVAQLANAQRRVQRAQKVAALVRIVAEAAREEARVGKANQLEVDAALLDLGAAEASLARARGEVGQARVRLARLLGRPPQSQLAVEDPAVDTQSEAEVRVPFALVDADPRVRAAEAELLSARKELETFERMRWPSVTLGASFSQNRRDLPLGAFQGPASAGLSANWTDTDLGFSLGVPLPLLDRQTQPRTRAAGQVEVAEARLRSVRLSVEAEVESVRAELRASAAALESLAEVPTTVERDLDLMEKAVRAGAIDVVARAQLLRRLEDAGLRYDIAVLELRHARARWARRTSRSPTQHP